MNRIIVLCCLAVVLSLPRIESAPNPTPANDHLDVVRLKNALNVTKIAQIEKMNCIVNDALLSIEINIRIAKNTNKEANRCYEPSRLNSKNLFDRASASIYDYANYIENNISLLSEGQIISLLSNFSQGPIETVRESVRIETQIAQICISDSK